MNIDIDGYQPAHLSYSTFDSYRTCARRFKLQKIDRVEQLPNWGSVGGSAVHSAIETIETSGADTLNVDELFSDWFDHHLAATQERSPSYDKDDYYASNRGKKNEDWWRGEGPRMVQRWLDWRQATGWTAWRTPAGDLGVELELNFTLADDLPMIKGYIDSVWVLPSGQVALADTKTGRIPDLPEQLGLYSVGFEQMFGIKPAWGYFWDAAKGSHGQPLSLASYTRDYFAAEYRQAVTGINAGVFLAKPQMSCHTWCGVRFDCPAVAHLVGASPRKSSSQHVG